MESLTGKSIDFKYPYDSVKAQYKADSCFVLLDNKKTLNLDTLDSFYKGSLYGHHKFFTSKVDFYQNGTDTLMFTYVFFKNRLFEIDIFTNIDSFYRSMGKDLEKFFKVGFVGMVQGIDKGHLSRNETKRKTQIMSEFLFDRSTKYRTFSATLMYYPIRQYLPVWCGTGKSRNWVSEMEKELNSH